jgi:hypothetical protein
MERIKGNKTQKKKKKIEPQILELGGQNYQRKD